MHKRTRQALKLEKRIQALADIKVKGTADERQYARKVLANGLSGRYQHVQRVDPKLVQTIHNLKGAGYAVV